MNKLYEIKNNYGVMEMYEGGLVRFPCIINVTSKKQTLLFPLKGMHPVHGTSVEVGTFLCRFINESGSTSSGTRKMYLTRNGSDENDYWLAVAATTTDFDTCEMNAGSFIDLGCFIKEC